MSKKKPAEKANANYEDLLYTIYENMGVQMIKWKGLPDTTPSYVPERYLFQNGQCCTVKVPGTDDFAILPVAYGSVKLDLYGNPTEWRAFPVGTGPIVDKIRNTTLNNDTSALIWNNQYRTGDADYIRAMIKRMVATDVTLDINIMLQRTPVVFKGDNKNLLTIRNIYRNYASGDPFVIDAGYDIANNSDAFNLGIPFLGAELSDQYETYHDRILRYLGINHLPVEKQERMLTGEVNSNNEEIEIRRALRMAYREKAVDDIRRIHGVEVSVEYVEPEPEQAILPGTSDVETAGSGPENGDKNTEKKD